MYFLFYRKIMLPSDNNNNWTDDTGNANGFPPQNGGCFCLARASQLSQTEDTAFLQPFSSENETDWLWRAQGEGWGQPAHNTLLVLRTLTVSQLAHRRIVRLSEQWHEQDVEGSCHDTTRLQQRSSKCGPRSTRSGQGGGGSARLRLFSYSKLKWKMYCIK
jgi:hypothetical protein